MDPHYSADDLLIITVKELRLRVSQVRTARAQQIAVELWRMMDEIFTAREPIRRRFLNDDTLIHDLAGPLGRGLLLELLRDLRPVRFKEVLDGLTRRDDSGVSEDSEYAKRRRRIHPNIAKARHLHTHLESIYLGGRRTPFHQRRNWVCFCVILTIAFGLWLNRDWIEQQFLLGIWRPAAILVVLGLVYGLWYRVTYWVLDKVRILALYMAFTDQFMPNPDGDPPHPQA